mmetsp:Transcript_5939/g.14424  ORF Transcript_5939/g.14424 Transcript_5939/m.14424 type:complete len:281 (-) Transcript_5939:438-1280(-)
MRSVHHGNRGGTYVPRKKDPPASLEAHPLRLVPEALEQHGGEIPLAKGRDDADHHLVLGLVPLGDLDGGDGGGARGDADHEALLGGHAPGHDDGVVARDLDDLIDDVRVAVAGHEASTDALDLVGARAAARQDGALGRLHSDHLDVGVLLLEVLPGARDGAAGADAGDKVVDLPAGALPDLGARGRIVDGGVGGVLKLLQDVRVRGRGRDLLRLHHGALHPLGGICEDQVSSKSAEQDAALQRHRGRHGEHKLVSLGRSDESKGDARVAARGLNERGLPW